MSTVDLTSETLQNTVETSDIVLVDFWAEWCGPCRQFAPEFEKSADTHTDIVHAKDDTVAEQELAAAAYTSTIPTIMAFREGVLVFSQSGARPATSLEELITAVKNLDMAEVHAAVEAQRAESDGEVDQG